MTAQWLKDYYATGKRVQVDGAPAWRPKWWGTLGNDKEFREATRERFNPAHYPEGTIRVVRNGIPYRFAAHVKKWKKANLDALCQGYDPFGLTLMPHSKDGRLVYTPEQKVIDHYDMNSNYSRRWALRKRMSAEYELNKFQFPPDLFIWARQERKRQAARRAS